MQPVPAAEDAVMTAAVLPLSLLGLLGLALLVEHCYSCHSADAKKLRGDLRLDTRAGVRKGGPSGPALIPGDPE
jgi:hypothetical protein